MARGICFMCEQWSNELERHHAFAGRGMRELSEKHGAVVELCPECHRIGKKAVHRCAETRAIVQDYCQQVVMENEGLDVEGFRAIFGKNYLIEETETAEQSCGTFGFVELEPVPLFC